MSRRIRLRLFAAGLIALVGLVLLGLYWAVRYEPAAACGSEFDLKGEVADLFEYTRDVEDGEIRCLAVRHGLPFSMEIELPGGRLRARSGGRHE